MHSKERSADSNSDHSDATTSAIGHHLVVDLNVSLRAAGTPCKVWASVLRKGQLEKQSLSGASPLAASEVPEAGVS